MSVSIALSVILGLVVNYTSPHLALVTLYKFSLVTSAGVAGYYLDREAFPYARPDMFLAEEWKRGLLPIVAPGESMAFSVSMLRRAIIMGALMLAVGLGA